MIRYLALNKWMPFRLWRYMAIPSISAWFDSRTFRTRYSGPVSMFARCGSCGKRKWVEDIILNCGLCGRCFDASFAAYLERQGEE